jgi:hypothetical protein
MSQFGAQSIWTFQLRKYLPFRLAPGYIMAIFSKMGILILIKFQVLIQKLSLNETTWVQSSVRALRTQNAKCRSCRNRLYWSDEFLCCSVFGNQQLSTEKQPDLVSKVTYSMTILYSTRYYEWRLYANSSEQEVRVLKGTGSCTLRD